MVAMVAGAEWAVGGVLTVMGASPIALLTAVDNLHLNAWGGKAVKPPIKHMTRVMAFMRTISVCVRLQRICNSRKSENLLHPR